MREMILLADNDEQDRAVWQRGLEQAGYQVRLASTPEQARAALASGEVDLAILDLRLERDNNPEDVSGLILAKERAFRSIPKILLTGFPVKYRDLREVLGPIAEDLPAAVGIVDKAGGLAELLGTVEDTLRVWPRIRMSTSKVADQIKSDHHEARRQAAWNYWCAFLLSIIGCIIIFGGIVLAFANLLAIAIVATTGGIIAQALSFLFFKRVNLANERMDVYHRELLQTYWVEFLLTASEELPAEKRIACREHTLLTAANAWLAPNGSALASTRDPSRERRMDSGT
jgi:CheY-like chemotaxis protein